MDIAGDLATLFGSNSSIFDRAKSALDLVTGLETNNKGSNAVKKLKDKITTRIGKGKNTAYKDNDTGEVFQKNWTSHGGENYHYWRNEKRFYRNPKRDDSFWGNLGRSRGR